MLSSECHNLIKWNGKERPFYEVYYLKANDLTMRTSLWVRYTFLSTMHGTPEAAVWAIFSDANRPANNCALKETVSMQEVIYKRETFDVDIGGAQIGNDHAGGGITQGANSISWDLTWRPSEEAFRHYPSLLYYLPWPSTKVVAPNLKVPASGWFRVNGRQYFLKDAPLHQGHIWGKGLSKRWAWADCGAFAEDKTAVLELLGTPSFGLGYLKTSKVDKRFRIGGGYSLDGWHFTGRGLFTKINGHIITVPQNIMSVVYDDTDGSKRYCYNTKIADTTVEVYKKSISGWKAVQALTSRNATAFEVVEPSPIKS